MKYLTILIRSTFFYLLITVLYRIMGKREIGELSIMDFIISIFIAEMAAISIENYESSILVSLIPIGILVVIQISLSYISMKNKKIRRIIDGDPSVIIDHGKVQFKEMKKQRYNIDDLLTQLRANSIKSIDEVEFAILETSGKLSIFPKKEDKKKNYPLPIILEGTIEEEVLSKINKSKEWVYKELQKENINIKNVYYGFLKENKIFIIENDKIC